MLNRYRGLNPYRGFESHPLRHLPDSIELFASAAHRSVALFRDQTVATVPFLVPRQSQPRDLLVGQLGEGERMIPVSGEVDFSRLDR